LINQRQGRRRGRGGQRQNGGGRGHEMGNRIDNRARGNAAQLLEKYKTLARDAQQSGDRVLAEYYLQFADHYFRVLAESRARYDEANPQARREARYDDDDEGGDTDGGDDEEGGDDLRQPPRASYREERQPRGYRDDDRQPRAPREDREPRATAGESNGGGQGRGDAEAPSRARAGLRPRSAAPVRTPRNADADDDGALPFDALPPSISTASAEPVAGLEGEPIALPKRRGRPRKVDVAQDQG
jgi:hypothetical protein